MPQFVILSHTFPDDHVATPSPRLSSTNLDEPQPSRPRETHWDWMFENEGELWTWATSAFGDLHEILNLTAGIPAQRLPDHRLFYLNYSGPVTGDRGHVWPIWRGQYTRASPPAELASPGRLSAQHLSANFAASESPTQGQGPDSFHTHIVLQDDGLRFWVNLTKSILKAGRLD